MAEVMLAGTAGPDSAVKKLLASIESLQQQQQLAEEARLDADEAERCANLEILELEKQLHEGAKARAQLLNLHSRGCPAGQRWTAAAAVPHSLSGG